MLKFDRDVASFSIILEVKERDRLRESAPRSYGTLFNCIRVLASSVLWASKLDEEWGGQGFRGQPTGNTGSFQLFGCFADGWTCWMQLGVY